MPGSSASLHDESDHESISDLLSPSDGYFAEGHTHPGEVLIPDPSHGATNLDKEREAREELRAGSSNSASRPSRIDTSNDTQAHSTTQSQPRSQPRSPTAIISPSRRSPAQIPQDINEATPLISSAPPAYSPPEPGSPYHDHVSNGNIPGIYQTIGRSNRFFPNSTEDMGGQESRPLMRDDDDKKSWSNRLSTWWDDNSYKVFKYIVLAFALMIAIGFIVDLVVELSMEKEKRHGNDGLTPPDNHGIPLSCKIVGSGKVDFVWEKSRNWKLLHVPKPPIIGAHHSHVQTMGKIHVQPSSNDAEHDIKVDMEYHYSSHAVSAEFEFSREDEFLKIVTAGSLQNYNDPPGYHPCLYLDITVWVKPGLVQDTFGIGTTTLNVIFEQNHTALANDVRINTLVGSVTSIPDAAGEVHWGGRDVKIITDSSSITGAFPLYDSLYLETTAGSIDADLTLHRGRYGSESEALLTLKSQAGSIRANTPLLRAVESKAENTSIDSIPKRDYHADVLARSGSVNLKLVHGSHTSIKSNAGSVHAELTPWLEPRKESKITVESDSGSVDITVRDSIAYKGQVLRHLFGDYRFSTGHLSLRYPAEWEGSIVGYLMTGSLNVDWPGLHIISRGRNGIYNRIEAKKGEGDASIKFSGASGGADLIGRGGSKYPSANMAGEDGDQRKVVDEEDGADAEWPIILSPFLKHLEGELDE